MADEKKCIYGNEDCPVCPPKDQGSRPQEAVIPSSLTAESVGHLHAALKAIAASQRFDRGDGQFTVIPSFTGYEAQSVAKAALRRAGLSTGES